MTKDKLVSMQTKYRNTDKNHVENHSNSFNVKQDRMIGLKDV